MSFDFGNVNPQIKAQAAYKDGSGMGGGGMYFKQGKKRKDQQEKDLFEHNDNDEKEPNEIDFDSDIPEEDIPKDSAFNKFVNWFRINNG